MASTSSWFPGTAKSSSRTTASSPSAAAETTPLPPRVLWSPRPISPPVTLRRDPCTSPPTSASIRITMSSWRKSDERKYKPDPAKNRGISGPVHHRAERCEEIRSRRPPKPLACQPPHAGNGERGEPEEHSPHRADRCRQDRDRPPHRDPHPCPLRQGRSDQVHRSRLRRSRRRVHDPRPCRRSRPPCEERREQPPRQGCGRRSHSPHRGSHVALQESRDTKPHGHHLRRSKERDADG